MRLNKNMVLDFNKIVYYSLIVFALVLPLSKAAISFFIFWFVILIIFKRDYRNSLYIIKSNKIFIYISIFLLYIFISCLFIDINENTLSLLGKYCYWLLVPILVVLIEKQWIHKIIGSFLVGMFISEIISYGIFFEFWSLKGSSPTAPAPFMNTIRYSVFLAFTSLILLYKILFEDDSIRTKFFLFLFFLITMINLMISTGRTGQLAFFFTLFIIFIMRYKISIKSFFLSTFFFIFIAFSSYFGIDQFKIRVDHAISDVNKAIDKNDFYSSWGLRASFWIITYDAIKNKPLFGYGVGNHTLATNELLNANEYGYFSKDVREFLDGSHFHNQYLMILVANGFIGLLIFLLMCYKIYKLEIEDKTIKHYSVIGITVFMIAFIAEPHLDFKFTLMLFLFIISFSIAGAKKKIKELK
ncbi:O-antigen ligase family protein [Aliarcobacter thereius]|uniref:O-Antigen ligase n=1 Tax=Aliarcobacter thereius LMG 24486 TaxID=1032240 RepID=A0A1C7WRU8_9BACT|nr:O-Antigen ligase [Aliarcobacter thereius LMG 24486]QBF16460.1 O-antigen ligase family protein [Aliarcobacter thereius LMG 24486]TLS91548.1 O-antigen ligase family protein [Aliarcobacter thereius]